MIYYDLLVILVLKKVYGLLQFYSYKENNIPLLYGFFLS